MRSVILFLCALAWAMGSEPVLQLAPSASVSAFVTQRVAGVMRQHCWSCHGQPDKDGTPVVKGHFSLTTLKDILQGGDDYAVVLRPYEPDRSIIYTLSLHIPGDDMVMPPKYKMSDDEIAVLRQWIMLGAPWPEGFSLAEQPRSTATGAGAASATVAGSASTAALPPESKPVTRQPRAATSVPEWIGFAHPALVHLPLGALLVALAFELLAFLAVSWRPAVTVCLLIAVLGGAAAIASGLLTGGGGHSARAVSLHEWAGWVTISLTVLALIWSALTHAPGSRRMLARVLLAAAVIASIVTGHFGGVMVHGSGWPW